jgi:heme-binding protein
MKFTRTTLRRGLFGLFASSALGAAAAATIAMPTAPAAPEPCTAAGLANTVSGITGDAGRYLDANPDVNNAITGAGSETPEQAQANLRAYFQSHPQQYSDLRGIAQPLAELRSSCNQTVSGAQIAALLQAFVSP